LKWNYSDIEKSLNSSIGRTSKHAAQEQIKLFSQEFKEQSKDRLNEALYGILNEAAPTMWVGVRKVFKEELETSKSAFQTFLKEFDKILPENELDAKVNGVQETCLELLRGILDSKVGEIDRLMLAKFKKVFLFEEDGTARTWEEGDLSSIFKEAKQAGESLLDLFCILRLEDEYEKPAYYKLTDSGITEIAEPSFPSNIVLMKKVEAHRALERFRDAANSELTIAKKDQERAMSSSSTPTYLWVLILILGANEIWAFISFFLGSWLGWFFLLMLASIAFAIYHLNLTPVILPIVRPMVNQAIQTAKEKVGMGGKSSKPKKD